MSIHLLLPAISIAMNLALLGAIFVRPVRLQGRPAFAAFLGTLIGWSAAQLGMGLATTAGAAEAWHKVLMVSTMLYVPLYLRFTERFTGRNVDSRFFAFVVTSSLAGIALALSNLTFREMVPGPVGYVPRMTVWFVLLVPALYAGGIAGLRNLWRTMVQSPSPTVRNRAGYLVVGSIAMMVFGGVDIASAMGMASVYVSAAGNLLFALFATLALLNDRVVDLHLVVRRQLGHLILVPLVGGTTIAVIRLTDLILSDVSINGLVTAALAVLVYALVSPLLHQRAHRWVDSLWYGRRARSLRTLKDFASEADSVHDMQLLGATMVYIVREAARAAHVTLLERVPGRATLRAAASVGIETDVSIAFPEEGALASELRNAKGAIAVDELKESPAWLSLPPNQREAIDGMGAALIVPITFNESVAGALMIGPPTDRRAYPQEETELLVSIAKQIAPAIENARLYDELHTQIQELKETQAQLVQAGKLATLGTLASGVAHEISNPLFSILGRVELLRRDAEEHLASQRAVDYVDSIHEMSERIAEIVRALLTFSRRDSARGPVDVHRLIDDTIGLVERDLALSRITVERRFAREPLHVVGNPAKLKQALMNVVLNARDAMPSGGKIVISTSADRGKVHISCADSGRGIQHDDLPRVFDAFFTTKDRGLGAGLGLYICNSIVDEHDGHITIDSHVGQGTVVTITLAEEVEHTPVGIDQPNGFQVLGAPVIDFPAFQTGRVR